MVESIVIKNIKLFFKLTWNTKEVLLNGLKNKHSFKIWDLFLMFLIEFENN